MLVALRQRFPFFFKSTYVHPISAQGFTIAPVPEDPPVMITRIGDYNASV
jgi:hypothetical protein